MQQVWQNAWSFLSFLCLRRCLHPNFFRKMSKAVKTKSRVRLRGQEKTAKCLVCRRTFVAEKRHPYQKICFRKACRRHARIEALRRWRLKYPGYFKDRTDNAEAARAWRRRNPNYYRRYRKLHPELKNRALKYVRAFRKRHAEKVRQGNNESFF